MNNILISLLVVTIFGALNVNGLRAFVERWAQKCKDAGVEYDSETDYRHFQEYTSCSRTSFDATQYMEDTNAMIQKFKLAELDVSMIKPTLQKYCQQANTFLNCTKLLSTECLTEEENLRLTIHGSMQKSFIDFFCDNDASGMTEFINGNGIECGMAKELELGLCFDQFNDDLSSAVLLSAAMGDVFLIHVMLPKAAYLCNSLQIVGNCITQLFQQCELSETPGKLIADLFSYIETKTTCATVPKIDKELQKLNPKWMAIQADIARLKLNETNTNMNQFTLN